MAPLRVSLCVLNDRVLLTVADAERLEKPGGVHSMQDAVVLVQNAMTTTVFRTYAFLAVKQRCDKSRWSIPMRVVPLTYLAMRLVATHLECQDIIADYQYYHVDLSLLFELLHRIMHDAILVDIAEVLKDKQANILLINPDDNSPVPYLLRIEMGVDCTDNEALRSKLKDSKLIRTLGVLFAVEWQPHCIVTSNSHHFDTSTKDMVCFCEKAIMASMNACASYKEWTRHNISDAHFEVPCPQCERLAHMKHVCPTCRCLGYCSQACLDGHAAEHKPVCKISRLSLVSMTRI